VREQLQSRLDELKKEFEAGQARLQELELQQARLRETMLRISGAIQVLEEMLAADQGAGGSQATPVSNTNSALP
jgi:predicted nuclease with TOPRIM domain